MHPEDVSRVAEIERVSFSTPWSETSFLSEIYNRHSITRVAEIGDVMVGYICARQIADECHLLDLAVHPDYRRHGIAASLFMDVLSEFKNCECRFFYLEVRATNGDAKKIYEKFGFKGVGTRKNYYINPTDDAVIMRLEL